VLEDPAALPSVEIDEGTHCIGGWVYKKGVEKILDPT
jgi:hypothetical protein